MCKIKNSPVYSISSAEPDTIKHIFVLSISTMAITIVMCKFFRILLKELFSILKLSFLVFQKNDMTIDFIVILVKIFSYFKKYTNMYITFDDIQKLTITILQMKKKMENRFILRKKIVKIYMPFYLVIISQKKTIVSRALVLHNQ